VISITPSHIIQYLYCPRFTYFEHVLKIPQFEEKNYKVMRGRHLHDEKLARNKGYLRKRIGVVQKWEDQYLTNGLLRGRVDEVLKLTDGTMAPLDYKFARFEGNVYNTYRTQLFCYAWLIEENFNVEVEKGFLVYTRSKHHLEEVRVTQEEKEKVKEVAKAIEKLVEKSYFPKATRVKSRCRQCTYRNICVK